MRSTKTNWNGWKQYLRACEAVGFLRPQDILVNKGIAQKLPCGDNFITTVDEPRAFEVYHDMIIKEPDFFIDPVSVHDYDKTFVVKDMVAL